MQKSKISYGMDCHPKFNDSECSIIFGTPAVTHLLHQIIFLPHNIHLINAVPCRNLICSPCRLFFKPCKKNTREKNKKLRTRQVA